MPDIKIHPALAYAVTMVAVFLLYAAARGLYLAFFGERCPKCRRRAFRKFMGRELLRQSEAMRTVQRVDVIETGATTSNARVMRNEQVSFVTQYLKDHWSCRYEGCGHQWTEEWVHEYEGSIPVFK